MKFYIASVLISYKQVHTLAQLLKSAGQRHTYDSDITMRRRNAVRRCRYINAAGQRNPLDRGLQSRGQKILLCHCDEYTSAFY